jgi:hypothetical protein
VRHGENEVRLKALYNRMLLHIHIQKQKHQDMDYGKITWSVFYI